MRSPLKLQLAIVWVVTSGLLTGAVVYLRAAGKISDAAFRPLAALVCDSGQRIETNYEWVTASESDDPSRPKAVALGSAAALRSAACVGPSGAARPLRGFLLLLWLPFALLVAIPLAFVPGRMRRLRRAER